jgi:hypothetical protein
MYNYIPKSKRSKALSTILQYLADVADSMMQIASSDKVEEVTVAINELTDKEVELLDTLRHDNMVIDMIAEYFAISKASDAFEARVAALPKKKKK